MMVGVPLVLVLFIGGIILNGFPRLRWAGRLGILAAVLIAISSFSSFKVLDLLGMVRYKHEQMVPVVPTVADMVVYLKANVTEKEIESFWNETLSTREDTGSRTRPGISGITRQAIVDGHEVIVVSYFPTATDAERDDIKSRVASSGIVYKLLEKVPSAEIENMLRPDSRR